MKSINKRILKYGFGILFIWLMVGFAQFTPDVKDPDGATEALEGEWEDEEAKAEGEAAILLGQALRCKNPDNHVITVVGMDDSYYCKSDPFYSNVYWMLSGGAILILTCFLSLAIDPSKSKKP